mmetsp:Transcript_11414/g.16827  ORF Transcript_11414/g.16827 Transcript_11414/m.16827 type:complete len:80 (-) Transcript_11414:30-269(-)
MKSFAPLQLKLQNVEGGEEGVLVGKDEKEFIFVKYPRQEKQNSLIFLLVHLFIDSSKILIMYTPTKNNMCMSGGVIYNP